MIPYRQSFRATCIVSWSYHRKHEHLRNEHTVDIHKYLLCYNFYGEVMSALSQQSLNSNYKRGHEILFTPVITTKAVSAMSC